MQNEDNILEVYQANKVDGRSEFCPRKGTYKIISVYQGTCLNKPATMATTLWKLNTDDTYTDSIFTVQLESFKSGLQPLNTDAIVGREIEVVDAKWFPKLVFALNWKLLPSQKVTIEYINRLLNGNPIGFDISEVDKEICIDLEDGEEADYGNL